DYSCCSYRNGNTWIF
nr:immunoglobulin light chain junction region [Macaca mulatta]MOW31097.1 immunoglobulin light chain junction region [Macaca mulatta]MOW31369.1 immunoglobulin light chain junction region [Macaca mulatta]